jgi:hypothetical protein
MFKYPIGLEIKHRKDLILYVIVDRQKSEFCNTYFIQASVEKIDRQNLLGPLDEDTISDEFTYNNNEYNNLRFRDLIDLPEKEN